MHEWQTVTTKPGKTRVKAFHSISSALLEKDLNAWFKENDARVDVWGVDVTTANGFTAFITYELVDE